MIVRIMFSLLEFSISFEEKIKSTDVIALSDDIRKEDNVSQRCKWFVT